MIWFCTEWTSAGVGTVHFWCFMNGCGVAADYPWKARAAWQPGQVRCAA